MKRHLIGGALLLLMGAASPVSAKESASCAIKAPPRDAGVDMGHRHYFFIYPTVIGERFTGCQQMWDEKGQVLFVLSFESGKLTRMRSRAEPGQAPLVCTYRKEKLVQANPEDCPEYDALASGFRSITDGSLEVPAEFDPRKD